MERFPNNADPESALRQAIALAEGPTKLAHAINGAQLPMPPTSKKGSGHVCKWLKRGRAPEDQVLRIEAVTGISRHRLRPDVFGFEPIPAPEERAEQPREAAE